MTEWMTALDEPSECQDQKARALLANRVRARVKQAKMADAAFELSKAVEEAVKSGLDHEDILKCVHQTCRAIKRSMSSPNVLPSPKPSPGVTKVRSPTYTGIRARR